MQTKHSFSLFFLVFCSSLFVFANEQRDDKKEKKWKFYFEPRSKRITIEFQWWSKKDSYERAFVCVCHYRHKVKH